MPATSGCAGKVIAVSQAVLVAVIGVDWEGRRQVLGVEVANRESRAQAGGSSWPGSGARGLHGVEYVVSDNHAGLKAAIREIVPEAAWQRCYVHFLRNALDWPAGGVGPNGTTTA